MTKRKFPHNPIGRNRYTARKMEYNGVLYTTKQLSVMAGISFMALHKRLYVYGWSIEEAMTTPVKKTFMGTDLPHLEIEERHAPGHKFSFSL